MRRLHNRNTRLFSSARWLIAAALFFVFTLAHAESASGIMSSGDAAVTAFSGVIHQDDNIIIDLEGPSVRILHLPPSDPFGLITVPKLLSVKAKRVGQVFGVALDDKTHPDIFVAATSAYGLAIMRPDVGRIKHGATGAQYMPGQFGPSDVDSGPNSIWRIDGKSGEVTLFANVSYNGVKEAPASLGGLAFDASTQQLFVADRATGMIHRFTLDGVDHGVYDHGVEGLTAAGKTAVHFDPVTIVDIQSPGFHTEDPSTWGFAPEARRVYAVAVYQHRLFYSVAGSHIWSVGILTDGSFANDPREEINVPALAAGTEIASIDFDDQGWMYVAERGASTGDYNFLNVANGGQNRVKRYAPNTEDNASSRWISPGDEYAIGMPGSYQNADGGVALNCTRILWATGERLLDPGDPNATGFPHIDGLQGTHVNLVLPANAPPEHSMYVNYNDYDADPGSRGHMGAIALLKQCTGMVAPPVEIGLICPVGTVKIENACMILPICPEGTVFRNGYCIFVDCPWGYVRHNHEKRCVKPPVICKIGTVYLNDRCVPVVCPPNLTLAPNGYCHCPPHSLYRHGQCVPPPKTCPRDQQYIDGQCKPLPPCKRGEVRHGNRCVPTTVTPPVLTPPPKLPLHPCPPGQSYQHGHCETHIITPVCPASQIYVNGHCLLHHVPKPKCPPGQIYRNGVCTSPVIKRTCPTGQIYRHGRCSTVNSITAPDRMHTHHVTVPATTQIHQHHTPNTSGVQHSPATMINRNILY